MTAFARRILEPAVIAAVALTAAVSSAAGQVPQAPGERHRVDPGALPPPNASPSVSNPPATVPRPEGVAPRVPEGFEAVLFAEGLEHARWLAVAPDGAVMLAEPRAGRITLLRDQDGDGRADLITPFAEGFRLPHGMAFHDGALYVADVDHVWRLPYEPGQTRAQGREAITPDGALGDAGGHWTRNIAFHPSGQRFYAAIGSRGNIGVEPAPRATIQEFTAEGEPLGTFASGLRNPVGIAFRPGSEELWAVVNERDGMGDGLVPDYLTLVERDAFYGWPYAYIGANPQPGFGGQAPHMVQRTRVPELLFRAHSAPLGLAFYDADQFPEEYRGDAFVGLHGSWNADDPQGYMVAHVPFEDGRPAGHYQSFATGFWVEGQDRARVWGRPVGVAVAGDGGLLVADDVGQTVWLIRYTGE